MITDKIHESDWASAVSAIEEVVKSQKGGTESAGMVSRLAKTFIRDLLKTDLSCAVQEMLAMDDHELMARFVMQSMENDLPLSLEAKMKLEGRVAFRELISKHGGALSQQQAADMLGITPDGIRKRMDRGKLLAIKQGDHHVYPVFQFGDNSEVVPHFDEILQLLGTESDVARVRFFLSESVDLGMSVIDALKKGEKHELIKRKARAFSNQGAA